MQTLNKIHHGKKAQSPNQTLLIRLRLDNVQFDKITHLKIYRHLSTNEPYLIK